MTTDERLERIIELQIGLIDTVLHLQVAVSGLRLEMDAFKAVACPDEMKEQLAQRIAQAANNFPPALQQLVVKLRQTLEELQSLRQESSTSTLIQ